MVVRIILFLIIGFAVFGIANAFLHQGPMTTTVQNLKSSIGIIAYADELDEISKVVDEFLVLRTIRETEDGKELAAKIDTLELEYENDPYEKLQQLCPSLKSVSLAKAVELFRLI